MDKLFELDEEKLDALLSECMEKEKDFRKKTMKKAKKADPKLWEKLFEENLKKEGYIK